LNRGPRSQPKEGVAENRPRITRILTDRKRRHPCPSELSVDPLQDPPAVAGRRGPRNPALPRSAGKDVLPLMTLGGHTAAMENVRYFHALAVFACRANRLYRIYLRPHELVFIWAGKGGEGLAGARAVSQRGGLHSVLGNALHTALDPAKKNDARRDVLDGTPLDLLVSDHPNNLVAPVEGFEEVRICPRSDRHARISSDHHHQALLRLKHRTLGKYRLGIASLDDTRVALTELPRILGNRCCVEIQWPEREQECGCVFCRNR
jgi:hypothetical protein